MVMNIISKKNRNLSFFNKIHLYCDVIDGSVVNGLRKPTIFNFALDKPSGYKVFCGPETIHYKKINISVLNTLTFYLEDDNNEEVTFNGETLTFTLQTIENWNFKGPFKKLKVIVFVLVVNIDLLQKTFMVIVIYLLKEVKY